MNQTESIPDEKFNLAYTIIAEIVTKYGDKYLPIFKRMHEEKLQRQANADLQRIAKAIVSSTDKQY